MYVRIIVIGLLCLLAIVGSAAYHLASSVMSDREAFAEQARGWTTKYTPITQIENISEYRGKQSYAVVTGKNRVGTPVIAWLTKDRMVFYDTLKGTISQKDIIATVQKTYPQAEIIRVVPGADEQSRFWETVFIDKEKRYNYVYYDFRTGKVLKSYMVSPPAGG